MSPGRIELSRKGELASTGASDFGNRVRPRRGDPRGPPEAASQRPARRTSVPQTTHADPGRRAEFRTGWPGDYILRSFARTIMKMP